MLLLWVKKTCCFYWLFDDRELFRQLLLQLNQQLVTDLRQMAGISTCILRFAPVTDLEEMHGLDEHIGVDEYKKSDWFYYRLMKRLK